MGRLSTVSGTRIRKSVVQTLAPPLAELPGLFLIYFCMLECNTVRIKTGVKETNKNGLLYISTEVHIACSVVIVSYWVELCLVVDKVDGVS